MIPTRLARASQPTPTRPRPRALALLVGLVLLAATPASAQVATVETGWRPLFNGKNLDGWYTFLQKHGKDRDPDRVITIEDGAIHLYKHAEHGSTVVMGYIATKAEHSNYHLRFEYRWGTKKFEPRLALKQDAGLYYHIVGDDVVWPRALQFQVEETNVGDLIALYGYQLDSWIDPRTAGERMPTFLEPENGGKPHVLGGSGIAYQKHLAGNHERDGWNVAEVIARGDTVTHILNGRVVNRGKGVRLVDSRDPANVHSHAKGRIALEIEAAEIYFRNVELKNMAD